MVFGRKDIRFSLILVRFCRRMLQEIAGKYPHFAQDVRLDNPQSSAPFVQVAYLGQRQGKDSFEASRWASTR